ncbi:MAG: metallophosphoesterase family protein [Ferruginibacter sp.]
MTRIGLISDTHNYLDETVFHHFADCDEIWHAGDFGSGSIAEKLAAFKPLRGVFGNIDGLDIRKDFEETLQFKCEDANILIQHIGGYPGRYAPGIKDKILKYKTDIFISGHSHILKVIYDDKLNCLHMNPGAAGKQGWQQVRTLIKFSIDGNRIENCEIIELPS